MRILETEYPAWIKNGIGRELLYPAYIPWHQRFQFMVFFRSFQSFAVGLILKEKFCSLILDLTKSNDKIFSELNSTTRNEVHKGQKIGLEFDVSKDTKLLQEKHQTMLDEKGIAENIALTYRTIGASLVVTTCSLQKEHLVFHGYTIDPLHKMAVLRVSASSFRNLSQEKKKLIGIANRSLHYHDILFFKEQGMLIYDFGGYCEECQKGEQKYGINSFKKGFGGEKVYYYTYWTIPMWLLFLFRDIRHKTKNFLLKHIALRKKSKLSQRACFRQKK